MRTSFNVGKRFNHKSKKELLSKVLIPCELDWEGEHSPVAEVGAAFTAFGVIIIKILTISSKKNMRYA